MAASPSPTPPTLPAGLDIPFPLPPTLPAGLDIPSELKDYFNKLLEQIQVTAASGVSDALQKLLPASADLNNDGMVTPNEKLLHALLVQFVTFSQQAILNQQGQITKVAEDAKSSVKQTNYMQLLIIIAWIISSTVTAISLFAR
jgi:hypothetical protein